MSPTLSCSVESAAHDWKGGTAVNIVLIGTYELGRQPFGLASPAAWLSSEGWNVQCIDLAVGPLDEAAIADADMVGIHVPMHTATRLAAALIPRLKALNGGAHICAFGLYAPMNENFLRSLGVHTVLGGEFEGSLASLARRVAKAGVPASAGQIEPVISLERLAFQIPQRSSLPSLVHYARVQLSDNVSRTVGYTEASRGCKHKCRHCPIVPIYGGRFRIVPREVVLADIEQQIHAGAQHITFGDPDFFNGPGHAFPLVQEMHRRFPQITYDVTIKVEHLLHHSESLELLRNTGCLFVTTAVEAIDDEILRRFDKSHTRADFVEVAERCKAVGLTLNPTFVTFTPWTSVAGYLELLDLISDLGLVQNVSPIQYAIRLLLPQGSLLLDLPEMADLVEPYDPESLCYPWTHKDPRVDQLHQDVLRAVQEAENRLLSRPQIFDVVRNLARRADGILEPVSPTSDRSTAIPHLSEPWYCCAEPTDGQLAALLPGRDSRI
jgi:radical SAM superfamily enzyme YgiQ (UPF0313 family)